MSVLPQFRLLPSPQARDRAHNTNAATALYQVPGTQQRHYCQHVEAAGGGGGKPREVYPTAAAAAPPTAAARYSMTVK